GAGPLAGVGTVGSGWSSRLLPGSADRGSPVGFGGGSSSGVRPSGTFGAFAWSAGNDAAPYSGRCGRLRASLQSAQCSGGGRSASTRATFRLRECSTASSPPHGGSGPPAVERLLWCNSVPLANSKLASVLL